MHHYTPAQVTERDSVSKIFKKEKKVTKASSSGEKQSLQIQMWASSAGKQKFKPSEEKPSRELLVKEKKAKNTKLRKDISEGGQERRRDEAVRQEDNVPGLRERQVFFQEKES